MTITAPAPVRSRRTRRTLLIGCALAGLGAAAGPAHGQAFNGNPTTIFGGVAYDRATAGVETVRVDTPTAVINWVPNSANFLPVGTVATFTNGINNPDFVVLNRIIFPTAVRFDGSVLSRLVDGLGTTTTGGTVMFSSPNGLIVGATGIFDVGSLVLTTLNVDVDGGGNFYNAATRGITLNGGPSPLAGAAVVTEAGAQLSALQPNSYVALIGQVVQHAGSTRVNGSAAYVAGEVVEFRANQGLFDIIVSTGSDNAVPLSHTGSTGGPANTTAADNHAIYLVAMPKNQAITAVLQGDIGFDPAVAVGVENGVIVLSAGANVVGGAVDRYGHVTGTPAPDQLANFEIRGGVVHSDLLGVARTNLTVTPSVTPTITFEQDVSLFASNLASISAATGETVDVLGNAIVSTAAFDTFIPAQINLTGGTARIFATDGGTIHIFGTATVDASARGIAIPGNTDAGSGTGGSADVTAGAGTVTVDGALTILATGEGGVSIIGPLGNGGAGTGGTVTLGADSGGALNANSSVVMNASGTASGSIAPTRNGAIGDGGTVRVLAFGASNLVIAGTFTGSANGTGGDVLRPSAFTGGLGSGGGINIGAADSNIDFNANVSFAASGLGGVGPVGGNGDGGTIGVLAVRGTIDFTGQTTGAANGTGGNAFVAGGPAGDGQGGQILISTLTSDAPSRIGTGTLNLTATGQGGTGGVGNLLTAGGAGGDGTGGAIGIAAESGNGTLATGALTASADGNGGGGGPADTDTGGGAGGVGQGGGVIIGTIAGPGQGGPTGSATFASANLTARGTGGGGGSGTGAGGSGTGGTVSLSATGAPVTVTGQTTLVADGQGAAGGNSPGGGVGTTGQGAGGTVNILAAAHPNTNAPGNVALAAVTGSANAGGGPTGNIAGSWHVGASGGSNVGATGMTLTAAASGTGIGLPPPSTLDPQNGAITVSGTAQLSTDGDIQVNASQNGRVAGGRYELVARRDVTVSHTAPAANALSVDVANLFIQAARNVTVNAGAATRATNITDIRALGLATIAGRVTGQEIRIGSVDLDLPATGQIGDAATTLAILDVDGGDNGPLFAGAPGLGLGPNQFTILGGTTAGPGYTLTNAEAGRIRAGTLRILAPAVGTAANRPPDLIVRDVTFNGGGAAAGVGTLEIISPGIGRVEGNVLMAGARPQDGVLLNARERLEVVTPTASIRVRDGVGAPGGTLTLVSNNLWIASSALIALLRADPNYAGRDDDLIDNGGVDAPRGYIEGNSVQLSTRGTLFVQNTTAARGTFLSGTDFGGVTTGAGGLTINSLGDDPAIVYAFGRRLNADGTFLTGDAFFFASTYNAGGAGYAPAAALNTCIIPTGQCPRRVPPDTGIDGKQPITGPTDGSVAILLQRTDEDDVIDSSFAADPLIEEPVTSGSEPGQWNCDPAQDGDCDAQPQ